MLTEIGARIGYGAGTGMAAVGQVQEEATWAAEAGFESFWVSQVFGIDPTVALAAVGTAAPGLAELGTSVVPLAGRHPLALAAQARTAQSEHPPPDRSPRIGGSHVSDGGAVEVSALVHRRVQA